MGEEHDACEQIQNVAIRFYVLTGVHPTIDQLVKITGLSKCVVFESLSKLITCGYFDGVNDFQEYSRKYNE